MLVRDFLTQTVQGFAEIFCLLGNPNPSLKVGAARSTILARRLVTMTQFPTSDVGSRAKWPATTRNPLMMSLSLKDSSLKTNQCGGSRRKARGGNPAARAKEEG